MEFIINFDNKELKLNFNKKNIVLLTITNYNINSIKFHLLTSTINYNSFINKYNSQMMFNFITQKMEFNILYYHFEIINIIHFFNNKTYYFNCFFDKLINHND
jgi:hypothetical protein